MSAACRAPAPWSSQDCQNRHRSTTAGDSTPDARARASRCGRKYTRGEFRLDGAQEKAPVQPASLKLLRGFAFDGGGHDTDSGAASALDLICTICRRSKFLTPEREILWTWSGHVLFTFWLVKVLSAKVIAVAQRSPAVPRQCPGAGVRGVSAMVRGRCKEAHFSSLHSHLLGVLALGSYIRGQCNSRSIRMPPNATWLPSAICLGLPAVPFSSPAARPSPKPRSPIAGANSRLAIHRFLPSTALSQNAMGRSKAPKARRPHSPSPGHGHSPLCRTIEEAGVPQTLSISSRD